MNAESLTLSKSKLVFPSFARAYLTLAHIYNFTRKSKSSVHAIKLPSVNHPESSNEFKDVLGSTTLVHSL